MAENTYNDNTLNLRNVSLIERLHVFIDEIQLWNQENGNDTPMPLLQFRALLLIAEIYEYVRRYLNNYENGLSDYFGEWTLRKCLEKVVEVEKLQKDLNDIHKEINNLVALPNHYSDEVGVANLPMGHSELRVLHRQGVDAFWGEEANEERPAISRSLLWNASCADEHRYKFGRLFQKANEELDDKDEEALSPDPNDHAYNRARQQNGLGNQTAFKAREFGDYGVYNDFDVLQYILDIQRKAEDASGETIFEEMNRALEMLRNVFMAEAEDIYYIRTGDFSQLEKIYDKTTINYLYTQLPFKKYYEARSLFVNGSKETMGFIDDLEVDLDNWRYNNKYTGRKLSAEEYEVFLKERRDRIVEGMKRNEELWKLREHSGGLDTEVTPENFARMFYRRKGVNRYFIELQWELEEITCLIEKNKEKSVKDAYEYSQSPEQEAVADFVDKIIILANEVYSEWNNKRLVINRHDGEKLIIIRKDELIKHMQDMMKNNFDELLEMCYPENSKSKQTFCKYVASLQKDRYFGELPNNLLSEKLGPIIGRNSKSIANYLSKFR